MEDSAPDKQQIMSSRSFDDYVTVLEPLNAAVASFIAIAAEKLRSQGSVAGMINVFMDRINTQWGRGTLHSAAEGTSVGWKMKRERMSQEFTTSWSGLPAARVGSVRAGSSG